MDRAWHFAPGVAVRTAGGSPEAAALAAVFSAFEVADATGTRSLSTFEVNERSLRVSLDGFPLFTVPRDALAPALEAAVLGWVVRTRGGVVPLHAAAIRWAGKAVLFLGDKGSGKSTLAAQLGGQLAYLGDEVAFVRIPDVEPAQPAWRQPSTSEDLVLVPFPKAATIKEGAFAAMAAATGDATWADPLRGPVRYATPAVTSRDELEVAAVVWPHWSEDASPAEVARLEPAEVAVRLIHQSFGGLERDPRTLDTLVALAGRPAFDLHHAHVSAARAVLEEALGPP